jgi:hypothetical protein
MSNPTTRAKVKSALEKGQTMAESLASLDAVCNAGSQCTEVQGSPVAAGALAALQSAVSTSKTSLGKKLDAAKALLAAIKVMVDDFEVVRSTSRTYESAVSGIAHGDATIINKAGLQSRLATISLVPLGKVAVVHTKPWKHPMEAQLTWPKAPGATGYAIEVNYTPQNPTGPWTALISGTGRRRIVKATAPGAQLLARVAALGSGGAQSDWSDPILVTTSF